MENSKVSVDKYLESNFSNNLPTPITYTGYKYERISVQSGNAKNWQFGSEIVFKCPEYSDSVWDTRDTMLRSQATITVNASFDNTAPGNSTVDAPLSQMATCAIEKFFLSSLLSDLQVRYGGVSTKFFESPNSQFPLLHAIYTLLNNRNDSNTGEVQERTTAFNWSLNGFQAESSPYYIKDAGRNPYTGRIMDFVNEAQEPYNICLDGDQHTRTNDILAGSVPTNNNWQSPFGFPVRVFQENGTLPPDGIRTTSIPNQIYSAGHNYRTSLIISRNTSYKQPTASFTAENTPFKTVDGLVSYDVFFSCRLYHPFLNNDYKKPANIPLEITLRRSKNDYGALLGDSQVDAVLADGRLPKTVDQPLNDVSSSSYNINFQNIELYMKRLYLAEDSLSVYREARLLSYDMQKWTTQIINITSTESATLNENLTFTKQPTLVLVGLIPKINYDVNVPDTNRFMLNVTPKFRKIRSSFDTVPPELAYIQSIYLNTSMGQIPDEPYESDPTSAGRNPQDLRAYEDFKKCFADPSKSISFNVWKYSQHYYAFIINSDQENPQYEIPRDSRSNINLRCSLKLSAPIVGAATPNPELNGSPPLLTDMALVVHALEWNQLTVTNLKNVAIIV